MNTGSVVPGTPQSDMFWGEIAPSEHIVQMYSEDSVFLDALEGYVSGGIRAGDGVIVIATPGHVQALEQRVRANGVDLNAAIRDDQFIAEDAAETLSRFMLGDWPDERRFERIVDELLQRAGRGGRRVRAFGEMVAILWAQGHPGATVRLEYLWHQFCQTKAFSLFCAYPKIGFTKDPHDSMSEICRAHSRILAG